MRWHPRLAGRFGRRARNRWWIEFRFPWREQLFPSSRQTNSAGRRIEPAGRRRAEIR